MGHPATLNPTFFSYLWSEHLIETPERIVRQTSEEGDSRGSPPFLRLRDAVASHLLFQFFAGAGVL